LNFSHTTIVYQVTNLCLLDFVYLIA
jgi:hypothetical protein